MTYSEFENRLNRYFDSVDENIVSALTEITGGLIYPTMSKHEKKVVYKVIEQRYSEVYIDYTLTNLLKNHNPSAFAGLCYEMTEEEKIQNNFYYIIFFEDKVF
nr:MAG TPA: hypothetical protein [Caudoviricetes sp.]